MDGYLPFQPSDNDLALPSLCVYVAVPEVYASAVRPSTPVSLTLEVWPGEVFHGTLVRHANAIDTATRTMSTRNASGSQSISVPRVEHRFPDIGQS